MLEIVPDGIDKWVGLQQLLSHLGLPHTAVMAGMLMTCLANEHAEQLILFVARLLGGPCVPSTASISARSPVGMCFPGKTQIVAALLLP